MTDKSLRAALLKLSSQATVPVSQFTPAQRIALDRFVRQTGAVNCQRQGRGDVYRVCDQHLYEAHLVELSPQLESSCAEQLPLRAKHLAHARSSKAGHHQHSSYYPLLKGVGAGVTWRSSECCVNLDASTCTRDFGAATLRIQPDDHWHTDQALWLVENQALFDRTDWLPKDTHATLLYYGGQLDGRLLSWLGHRPRAHRVIIFPDYDGIGLANIARLYKVLGNSCECWLMPHLESKLARYGSNPLWRDTLPHFTRAVDQLPPYMRDLAEQMRRSGLALEQEAVWLPE